MKWLTVCVALLFSCRDDNRKAQSLLLNSDSLINQNINYLTKAGASLEKTTRINESNNTIQLNSNKVNWTNELEAFRVLSQINKPVYSGAYKVVTHPDEKSNLIVKSWSTEENLPVRSIKIYYLNDQSLIKRLEAQLDQKNFVFSSTKDLTLNFDLLNNKPTLERYEISGYQKFFWEEPQYYLLEGTIGPK